MANLSASGRTKAYLDFMREMSIKKFHAGNVLKSEVKLLVDNIDEFLDGEKLNFVNNYLDASLSGKFNAKSITWALALVALERLVEA